MKFPKFFSDVKYLWFEQVLELRPYWFAYAVFAVLLPLTMTFGLTRIGGQANEVESLLRITVGAAIFSLANDAFYVMAIRITTMLRDGMIVYYAALPISKSSLIVALMLSRTLIALPGMLASLFVAPLVFHFQVYYHPLLLLVIPLAALLLAAVGMALGLLIKTVDAAQTVSLTLLYVLVMATPVFIPLEALPAPLKVVSLFLPFTYMSEALNKLLQNAVDITFWIDVGVLCLMTAVCLVLLERKLGWQSD